MNERSSLFFMRLSACKREAALCFFRRAFVLCSCGEIFNQMCVSIKNVQDGFFLTIILNCMREKLLRIMRYDARSMYE